MKPLYKNIQATGAYVKGYTTDALNSMRWNLLKEGQLNNPPPYCAVPLSRDIRQCSTERVIQEGPLLLGTAGTKEETIKDVTRGPRVLRPSG